MIIRDLGLIDYGQAYEIQCRCVTDVIEGRGDGYLLLCEHPPVLTLGRLADDAHIICANDDLEKSGIDVVSIDRGGEVTLHAPGQLVAYPILDLGGQGRDLHKYLYKLEQLGIDFLDLFDIVGDRVPGKTGVWVGSHKIMSVGIGVRKWVSYHGIALNINIELSLFKMIRPCGMDIVMTSFEKEKGARLDMAEAKTAFKRVFEKVFGV